MWASVEKQPQFNVNAHQLNKVRIEASLTRLCTRAEEYVPYILHYPLGSIFLHLFFVNFRKRVAWKSSLAKALYYNFGWEGLFGHRKSPYVQKGAFLIESF